MTERIQLTVAQAVVKFLAQQYSERDGVRQRLVDARVWHVARPLPETATGSTVANASAAGADLVVGIGTRWSDFTTASMSAFRDPAVRFVNINVADLDGHKLCGLSVVADAREALQALTTQLTGWRADPAYTRLASDLAATWDGAVAAGWMATSCRSTSPPMPPALVRRSFAPTPWDRSESA